MTAYVAVFKDLKGKYLPNFCSDESAHEANLALGKELNYELVYQNNFRSYEPCLVVEKFIRDANEKGKFDAKDLESRLGVKK
ncbi:MAG: hypothetical protein WCK29_01390 [archaeon]